VSGNDVFAGGYCQNSSGVPVAGYWLNGTWVGLALPTGFITGDVNALVVSASDIYAAGTINNYSVIIPGYWLNGTWVGLTQPTGSSGGNVTSIVVQ
jgi:hypothetical protein